MSWQGVLASYFGVFHDTPDGETLLDWHLTERPCHLSDYEMDKYNVAFRPWFEKMRWGAFGQYDNDDEPSWERECFKGDAIKSMIEAGAAMIKRFGDEDSLLPERGSLSHRQSRQWMKLKRHLVVEGAQLCYRDLELRERLGHRYRLRRTGMGYRGDEEVPRSSLLRKVA